MDGLTLQPAPRALERYRAEHERTLGQLLMILPPEDVYAVEGALVWAGLARVEPDDGGDAPT